ncbi:MAG: tetratricopeptide repeat protein [Planctomycetota bacterium]
MGFFSWLGLALLVILVIPWRVSCWEQLPQYGNAQRSEGVFFTESALQYRYAKMIAQGIALPEQDFWAQYPEGFSPYKDLALGKEYVEGLPYRWFGLSMPFYRYIPWAVAVASALGILGCFFAALLLWRAPLPALVSAALYAVSLPAFRRTIGNYSDEHFSLPFLLVGLPFLAMAATELEENPRRLKGRLLANAAGAAWAVALCTWHFSRFAFLIALGWLFLSYLVRPDRRGPGRALIPLLAWCGLAALWHPMLHARNFLFSGPMLLGFGLLACGLLPQRIPLIAKRAAAIALPVLLLLFSRALPGGGEEYSHVTGLLLAKLCHPLGRPPDPSVLSFEARSLWQAAFVSPSLHQFLYNFFPVLPVAAAGFACLAWRRCKARPDGNAESIPRTGWLVYATLAYGANYLLAFRIEMFLSFYLALWVGGLAYWGLRKKRRARRWAVIAVLAPLFLLEGYKAFHCRLPLSDRYYRALSRIVEPREISHIPSFDLEWGRALRWIERETGESDAVVGQFKFLPSVLLETGRPILIHPKYETTGIRKKLDAFYDSYFGEEESFYAFCSNYKARIVLVDLELALERGPNSPLYMAGKSRLAPAMTACKMHFNPGSLKHFEVAYQNSRFRIFRALSPDETPSKNPWPVQSAFDPAFFGAEAGEIPPDEAVRKGLQRIVFSEGFLREGLSLYRNRDRPAAAKKLAQALSLHAGLPQARPLLAQILRRRGELDAALDMARDGAQYEPDMPEAWYALGLACYAKGRYPEAKEALDRALRLDPGKLENSIRAALEAMEGSGKKPPGRE